MFLYLTIVVVLLSLRYYINKKHKYWDKKNVVVEKPGFFFGSLRDFIFLKRSTTEIEDEIYNKHKDARCVGAYIGLNPKLILKDPALIKQVLLEDFNSFHSRGVIICKQDILGDTALFMDGARWKLTRQNISSFFTPKKLKEIIPVIQKCTEVFNSYLNTFLKHNKCKNFETLLGDYMTDVITACAFGIDAQALTNKYSPFKKIGRNFFSKRLNIIFTIENTFPWLYRAIGLQRFKAVDENFNTIFSNVLKNRETNKGGRHDFINVCMELKKHGLLKSPHTAGNYTIEVTDAFLSAQAFFFYLAGHDTTSTTLLFALYELAHHPHILQKLHEEIDTIGEKHKDLTHVSLEEAQYLDNVITETLRKYPVIGNLERKCAVKQFKFKDSDITIDDTAFCLIPVFSLHRDPKYYPEPLKFDPDRIENKKSDLEKGCYYMPFGIGPRNCLGKKFAILQMKGSLFCLLREFTLKPTTPYEEDLKMKPLFLALKPENLEFKFVIRETIQHKS